MSKAKLSIDTKISIQDFVKKVMKPATKKTETSIVNSYDSLDPIRIKHSYGHLEGSEIIEAVNRYPGKLNLTVAENQISQIAEEQNRQKAKKMEIELEARGGVPHEVRGDEMKLKIKKMRIKQANAQKEKIKKESAEKLEKNIQRTKASETQVEDMPID